MNKKFLAVIPLLLLAAIALSGCADNGMKTLTIKTISVDGTTETPLGNVNIQLYTNYNISGFEGILGSNLSGSLNASATTDDSGYASRSLLSSKYSVNAWKNGYYSEWQEVTLDSDKAITVRLYPIKQAKLSEILDRQEYIVVQSFVYAKDSYNEWRFDPAIKFDAGKTSFKRTSTSDDYQYFSQGAQRYEILDMNSEQVTVQTTINGSKVAFSLKPGIYNNVRTSISFNNEGLTYIRTELVNQK